MKTKIRKIYYCEYCKKHGMRKPDMEKHEKHCTLNMNRKCRLCGKQEGIEDMLDGYLDIEGKNVDAEELMDNLNGCPVCTLAVIRCSRKIGVSFDYEKELQKWWSAKNEEAYQEEMQQL